MTDHFRRPVRPPHPALVPPASIRQPAQAEQPSDPVDSLMRDRRMLQHEITGLNAQLAEATGTINGLRAELDARDREIDRLENHVAGRDTRIARLQAYVFSIRTRLKVCAEMAMAAHAESMTDAVHADLAGMPQDGPAEAAEGPSENEDNGADDEAEANAEAREAAEAAEIIGRLAPDRGGGVAVARLPINRFK